MTTIEIWRRATRCGRRRLPKRVSPDPIFYVQEFFWFCFIHFNLFEWRLDLQPTRIETISLRYSRMPMNREVHSDVWSAAKERQLQVWQIPDSLCSERIP